MKSNVVKFAFVLMITSGLAIAGVALVYGVSKPRIEQSRAKTIKQSLALAFNMTDEEFADYDLKDVPEGAETPECWALISKADKSAYGYAARGSATGYGGGVEVIAAFKPDRKTLIGAFVTDASRETPGLGQNAVQTKPTATWLQVIFGIREVEEQHGKPLDKYVFLSQFQGKDDGKLMIAKNPADGIMAMSGSTITSQAVVNAVNDALKKIKKQFGDPAHTTGATGATQ